MPEHVIQNEIFRAFGTRSDMRIWRANTGVGFYADHRTRTARLVRFGVPGQADVTGILPVGLKFICPHCDTLLLAPPVGRRLEIEVKSPTGRQTAEQRAYQAMIERFGGLYVLARSVDDVQAAIDLALEGLQ